MASKRKRKADTSSTVSGQGNTACSDEPISKDGKYLSLKEHHSPFIKKHFLVDMPDDFYDFWLLAEKLNDASPTDSFQAGDLFLVGPFDVLAGNFSKSKRQLTESDYLLHWRYYFDVPEFQTVVRCSGEQHIGYYRDNPNELPDMVCFNDSSKDCSLTIVGDNIFAAVRSFLLKKLKEDKSREKTLKPLIQAIEDTAAKKKYSLDARSSKVNARKKKEVCPSFHGAGLVVPVENDVGYRPLPESNANLKKLLKSIAEAKDDATRDKNMDALQEIITYVQFANDECDYGEGLELGIDLFCSGYECFNTQIKHLLSVAYMLLNRESFGTILEAHLNNRRKGSDVSIL